MLAPSGGDPYYQAQKSHKSYAPPSKQSSSTRSNATTKLKCKEIAKQITPSSESASEKDSDPEQAQRDKNMYKNDNQTGQFGNQRTSTIVGARETVGSQKTKRVKDYMYHKEKMLCKQTEKGIPLQVEHADWLEDTDEDIDEQELEAHYNYMEKIQERQHFVQPEFINNTCVVEKVDNNVIPNSPDICDNDIQTDQNVEDEGVTLANLIENLTLDTEENKKILKQLKKANASLTQELKESKSNLEESNTTRDSCLIALQSEQTKLEMYMTLNDRTVDYDKLERK
ncbi:hypothetical protein Tco_0257324 [Tanacetum coccineum]